MAGDWDWVKAAVQVIAPLVTGVAGLFLGAHQAGKKKGREDAEAEAKIKDDINRETDQKFEALRAEMRAAVAEGLDSNQEFIKSVGDTFTALRQKINDVELKGAEKYLEKGEFKEFREKYDRDQARMDGKLDRLLGLKGLQ